MFTCNMSVNFAPQRLGVNGINGSIAPAAHRKQLRQMNRFCVKSARNQSTPLLQTPSRALSVRRALLVVLITLGLPGSAMAHPHVWVDIKVSPSFDDSGNLVAFDQRWRFDTFYSVVLMEEIEQGGDEGKARLLDDIVRNLAQHEFYTRIRVNGERRSLADVEDFDLETDTRTAEFLFTLPLAEPVTARQLRQHGFSYQIYEPTYYMEMLHAESEGIQLSQSAERCHYTIEPPEPTMEQLQRAVEVDDDGVAEDPTLGQHFAETVFIQCD